MNESKPMLAIETSETLCSAALYYSDLKFFSANINLKHAHSEKLFEIINFLFETAGLKSNEISAIAVSGGPGSFTGLRIGMAAAKGIAYGAGVPVAVIPTFEAMAYQLTYYLNENSEFVIANRVNRDEVYYAKFQISSNSYIFVNDLTILNNEEFVLKADGCRVFGNAVVLLNSNGKQSVINIDSPSAEFIAKWAIKFGKDKFNLDYNYIEPIYIKEFLIKERKKK
ncbi:tRNA threonylcarbamoyladenosine biosynthesis protein TsaB [bacterium BMS3Abin03]|nr:tRNA threonylcarbamoyladenosine biosynthesis protein TsaB [bacterium BMS3Abin03]